MPEPINSRDDTSAPSGAGSPMTGRRSPLRKVLAILLVLLIGGFVVALILDPHLASVRSSASQQ